MRPHLLLLGLGLVLGSLALFPAHSQAAAFSAASFAGKNGLLTQKQAALYIVHRDKVPLADLMAPGDLSIDPDKLVLRMEDKLDDLRSKTGHEAPWTVAELDHAFPPAPSKAEKQAALPAWRKVAGLTQVRELGKNGDAGKIGPVRIRRSTTELVKGLGAAKGATVAFSNNHLQAGHGVWNTEGAIDYPITLIRQTGLGKSVETSLSPTVEWRVAQTQNVNGNTVEELGLSLPLTAYISPGLTTSALWVLQAKPYFQTDFSGGHEIYGAQASMEFVGDVLWETVYLGGFQNIGSSGLQYQLRLIPQLDYSATEQSGQHTKRVKGDGWLRAGGLGSLDFRLGASTHTPLDLGISYQMLDTLSGNGGFASLFRTYATLWFNPNAGLTFEYSRGETPIATQKIDLLTLGFEFKY